MEKVYGRLEARYLAQNGTETRLVVSFMICAVIEAQREII